MTPTNAPLERAVAPRHDATWSAELQRALRVLAPAALAVPLLLLLAGMLQSSLIPRLTRDPAATGHLHPLIGMVSHLGVLLWCAATVVCLFAATRADTRAPRGFFGSSAALTGYMMVDDLFMLHEVLLPSIQVPERVVLVALMVATALWAWHFRAWLTSHRDRMHLAVAFVALGLSVGVDDVATAVHRLDAWEYFLEDGLKWVGICAWASFFWRAAGRALPQR